MLTHPGGLFQDKFFDFATAQWEGLEVSAETIDELVAKAATAYMDKVNNH